MKKNDVKIGGVYTAKVTNKLVQVRIDGENARGGWDATSLVTGKRIRIKSAQRLRGAAKTAQGDAVDETPVAGIDQEATPSAGPKRGKPKRVKAEKRPKKMGGLDAAAKVLEESGQPMTAKELVEAAEAKGYWKSPGGKTPHATVYSAILREIRAKGAAARFRKADRGKFARA